MAVDLVAQHFYGGDWRKVQRMNIYSFDRKLKFLGYKMKKELSNSKGPKNKNVRRRN